MLMLATAALMVLQVLLKFVLYVLCCDLVPFGSRQQCIVLYVFTLSDINELLDLESKLKQQQDDLYALKAAKAT